MLALEDMQAFFKQSSVVQAYMDDMDGYSNGKETAADGKISREEFYGYFDHIAEGDTKVAESSPAAYAALRDMLRAAQQ